MNLSRPLCLVFCAVLVSVCLPVAAAAAQQNVADQLNDLVGAANASAEAGEYDRSIDYLDQVLALDLRPVERFEVLLIRANTNRRAGNHKAAATDWRAALETGEATPGQHDAIMGGIADVWIEEDNRQALAGHVAAWQNPGPAAAPALFWLTREWLLKDEFDHALAYARPLAEIDHPDRLEHLKILIALLVLEEKTAELDALISRFEDETTALMNVPDMDAEPLFRRAVAYPDRAAMQERSGYCDMTFGVNPRGETENISAECSSEVFKDMSVSTVKKWRYLPRIEGGKLKPRKGVKTRLNYTMSEGSRRMLNQNRPK
ncbi:MAG: energy transducer TonB [Euryhalocaulis sp.]|uniref:energy transducer TonB n=1 Tax=Euryhalocaulis sp. TaxID=2744307 RepID=UPI0017B2CA01|nr:energy transducer TonB [Euryhalocaulis sp.]MBA4800576.1 energy transducer TonB [Euryhalocaulis sp.]